MSTSRGSSTATRRALLAGAAAFGATAALPGVASATRGTPALLTAADSDADLAPNPTIPEA